MAHFPGFVRVELTGSKGTRVLLRQTRLSYRPRELSDHLALPSVPNRSQSEMRVLRSLRRSALRPQAFRKWPEYRAQAAPTCNAYVDIREVKADKFYHKLEDLFLR